MDVVFQHSPEEIDTSKSFTTEFLDRGTRIAARWVVKFCQERGQGWEPFTYKEINDFWRKKGGPADFSMHKLVTHRWLMLQAHDYQVTPEFVETCFQISPEVQSEA